VESPEIDPIMAGQLKRLPNPAMFGLSRIESFGFNFWKDASSLSIGVQI
jgi:hypothetical protein